MDQRKKRKSEKFIQDQQGVALIYALVVMTVIFALALALLYGVGQVSLMTNSNREQEECYIQAVTLSEVIGEQLTSSTGGGIYDAARKYMPMIGSDSIEESERFRASTMTEGYGDVYIRFQNGIDDGIVESPNWESMEKSNQFLDLTVEVWGEKGGKESVTTRYRYYQQLENEDMEYTLYTNMFTGDEKKYTCEYSEAYLSGYPGVKGHLIVKDGEATVAEPLKVWKEHDGDSPTDVVTMEMAEKWAGQDPRFGTRKITVTDIYNQQTTKEVNITFQLTRKRKEVEDEEGDEGRVCRFQKSYSR